MDFSSRLARGVTASFAAQLVDKLVNGLLILLLARYLLDPDSYGTLYFVLSVLGVVAILGELGLPKSAARYVAQFREEDPAQVPHVLRRGAKFTLLLAATVGVVFVLASGPLARTLGKPGIAPLLAAGVGYVWFRSLLHYHTYVFQGLNRVTWSAAANAVNGVVRLLVAVGLVLLGFGVLGALLGYVVGFAAATLVGAVVLYRRFYRSFPDGDAAADLSGRILKYSVPLTATEAANVLDKKVDTVVVGVLLNFTAVGYYTLARQVADFVVAPALAFGFALSPNFGELKAGGETDRAARIYQRALVGVLLLYVPAAVGLFLVARPAVVIVFGTGYAGAVPVLQIFSAFLTMSAVNTITTDTLDYLGRARARSIAKTTMAVANLGLNLLLVPVLGVVGAALATIATYGVYTAINLYTIHAELSLDLASVGRDAAVVCGVALGMAVVVAVARGYISGAPTLVGTVLLGGGAWLVLAVGTGMLDPREVRAFLS